MIYTRQDDEDGILMNMEKDIMTHYLEKRIDDANIYRSFAVGTLSRLLDRLYPSPGFSSYDIYTGVKPSFIRDVQVLKEHLADDSRIAHGTVLFPKYFDTSMLKDLYSKGGLWRFPIHTHIVVLLREIEGFEKLIRDTSKQISKEFDYRNIADIV